MSNQFRSETKGCVGGTAFVPLLLGSSSWKGSCEAYDTELTCISQRNTKHSAHFIGYLLKCFCVTLYSSPLILLPFLSDFHKMEVTGLTDFISNIKNPLLGT